ncbi:2,4-dichlorophenol 6-monooxygenase [Modestobacter roseus]|uniref:2,4-dichlorophenol 6-monooxygenase n=2 Tax=Modestobacter roseus TaxID=1181884 RepID=A0A562IPC7_9ACTN|nr:2,4-dichlorophenol 6-monooxygenase [Modestobacter roseus]
MHIGVGEPGSTDERWVAEGMVAMTGSGTGGEFDGDVLVVGTGPMGATTALALATYGVRVLVVDRRNWLADSPRAHVTNLRTMEVLRSLGVEGEVRTQATPWELMGDTTFAMSLGGPEIARISSYGLGDGRYGEYRAASPCRMADVPQPLLEPVLVNAAAQRGAVFSFNTTYRASVQDAAGVTVTLEDRTTGRLYERRVRYLVGADGARSRVAADAGLPLEGELRRAGTVYAQFSGDLSAYMRNRQSVLTWIVNDAAAVGEIGLGLLRAVRPWDRWIAGWGFDIEAGDPDVSVETARARIKAYVGDPAFEPEVGAISPWYVNEAWATTYSAGRIFCGGDAVHRHPPSNGLGSNTSIQDAFNLAWKLAYVLGGRAAPALLDSYSQERAPVGRQVVGRANQSRREYAALHRALAPDVPGGAARHEKLTAPTPEGARARSELAAVLELKENEYNALGVELNHRYTSDAVIPGDEPDEIWERDPEIFAQPTTRPGAKLPHAWLVGADGEHVSTLDLVGDGAFTLLTGLTGGAWVEAVRALALPFLRVVVMGGPAAQDLYFAWQRAREVAEDGAILVRPDGYVAWRSHGAPGSDAGAEVEAVLARLLRSSAA